MIAKSRLLSASLLLLVATLFVVFVSEDGEAATYTVDSAGGSDYTNITMAVENASAGDSIRVAARNYHDAVEINKKQKAFKKFMSPQLSLRYTPDIRFILDETLAYSEKIDNLLKDQDEIHRSK